MSYPSPNVTASGTTFAQLQAAGASGHLERLISAQAATLAPTVAATWSATGGGSTGGSLAAGTYFGVVTETNGFGETTASPQQTQITVAAGNQPQITFQSLKTGNTARNVYLGAVNGLTGGPYFLYATGITTSTYTLATAVSANSYAVQPPTVNTTGLTWTDAQGNGMNLPLVLLRGAKDGNLEGTYRLLRHTVYDFLRGDPMTFNGTIQKVRHCGVVFTMLATLCNEIGTLIDANAGTFGASNIPIGLVKTVRTWP
jgi:hypothetical protein